MQDERTYIPMLGPLYDTRGKSEAIQEFYEFFDLLTDEEYHALIRCRNCHATNEWWIDRFPNWRIFGHYESNAPFHVARCLACNMYFSLARNLHENKVLVEKLKVARAETDKAQEALEDAWYAWVRISAEEDVGKFVDTRIIRGVVN